MGGAMVLWYVMMNRMSGGAGGVAKFSKARTRRRARKGRGARARLRGRR